MKLISLSLLLIICFGCKPDQKSNDQYQLSFVPGEPGKVLVEAKLFLEDSLLYMSENGPMPHRWPEYIQDLTVIDEQGKELSLDLIEHNNLPAWVVSSDGQEHVQLSYTLSLTHEEQKWPGGIDGVAFQREWGIFLTGRSLFIMNGQNKQDITIYFNTPENWKATVPFTGIDERTYTTSNLEDLSESLIFAGTHESFKITKGDLELEFAIGGENLAQEKEKIKKTALDCLNYYEKLMRGLPKDLSGNSLKKMVVIMNQAEQVDGEVIGRHINMFLNPNAPAEQALVGWFIFAHEFFHLWNGQTIFVENSKTDWFKEGITSYYTLKALDQIGFTDEKGIKMVLDGLFYQRYIHDEGLGELSMRDAASGFDKDNHWGLVYGGGMFSGICIDMHIRKYTDNKKSLDDLMRTLYTEFGSTGKAYNTDDILEITNKLSGKKMNNFFEKYIYGNKLVPLADYLQYAGIEIDTTAGHLQIQQAAEASPLQKEIWQGFLGEN